MIFHRRPSVFSRCPSTMSLDSMLEPGNKSSDPTSTVILAVSRCHLAKVRVRQLPRSSLRSTPLLRSICRATSTLWTFCRRLMAGSRSFDDKVQSWVRSSITRLQARPALEWSARTVALGGVLFDASAHTGVDHRLKTLILSR